MSKIDTITTAGKVAVMEAEESGKEIEATRYDPNGWFDPLAISWNWSKFNYRIKPQTLHQAARESIEYNSEHTQYVDGYHAGAKFGAKWQREQDNDQ